MRTKRIGGPRYERVASPEAGCICRWSIVRERGEPDRISRSTLCDTWCAKHSPARETSEGRRALAEALAARARTVAAQALDSYFSAAAPLVVFRRFSARLESARRLAWVAASVR